MILSLKNIFIEYQNRIILNNVDINIDDSSKIGLIGNNGEGKTTLLKAIYNYKEYDCVSVKPNLKIAYLHQDTMSFNEDTIMEYMLNAQEIHNVKDYEIMSILNKLGLNNHNASIDSLSGGQRKCLALAKVLIYNVDLLILDEPTNHLDVYMIEWLEKYLLKINCALIMISHDRYFLENIAKEIYELDQGHIYTYEGNYSTYLKLKEERFESSKATYRKQKTLLKKEQEWMMRQARARETKSKDRIERFHSLEENLKKQNSIELKIDTKNTRIGKKVLELNNVSFGYEDKVLVNDFSCILKKNDCIGLVGLNGSGKSTILRTLQREIEPIYGNIDFGPTVKVGYFSQKSDIPDTNITVIEHVQKKASFIETNDGQMSASKFLEQFLFDSSRQYTLINKISGGEKRRLALLSILMTNPNFLILDEPTNDLDILTLQVLEDFLQNFNGVCIIVSHDRYFMDKVCNSYWVINANKIKLSNEKYTDLIKDISIDDNAKKEKTTKSDNNFKQNNKEKKLRFTYLENKEYNTIDEDIEKLNNMIKDYDIKINNAAHDYILVQELVTERLAVEKELELKNERWLYLYDLAEQIENSINLPT